MDPFLHAGETVDGGFRVDMNVVQSGMFSILSGVTDFSSSIERQSD